MADALNTELKPLEGTTTIDDKMFFEPERLSYASADVIAAEIAEAITVKKDVVIVGTDVLLDFANLRAAYLTLDSLALDYAAVSLIGKALVARKTPPSAPTFGATESLVPSIAAIAAGAAAAISPVTSVVTAGLGLLSFFREDVDFHGAKTNVDDLAFRIALAAKLVAEKVTVYVPELTVNSISTASDSLTARLNKAQAEKANAWAAVGPLVTTLVQLEADLETAARDKNQKEFDRLTTELSNLRRDMQPVTDQLARADQRLASLLADFNTTDNSSRMPMLARLLRAEFLLKLKPSLVYAKVVSSGGHHRITRSLLRTIFVGDGLSFMGGAVVSWALLNEDGSIQKGGILEKRIAQSFATLSTQ